MFQYRIYDKIKKEYLDRNLYYVSPKGIFYKQSSPLPVRLQAQSERYEVRIISEEEQKNET